MLGVWRAAIARSPSIAKGVSPQCGANVDTIVVAMLRQPVDDVYHALDGKVAERHLLGDALAPRKPIQVMYEAEELGRAL